MGCCYSVKCSKCDCPLEYYTGNGNDPVKGMKRSLRKSCRVHDNTNGKHGKCKDCKSSSGCYHNWEYKLTIPFVS